MIYKNLEQQWRAGNLPTWMYCQLNGKSPQENWYLQHEEIMAELDKRNQEKELEAQARKAMEAALEELLKDFNK